MPRRTGNLWSVVIDFSNLLLAHRKARRGKRDRPEVAAFDYDLEANLLALRRELASGTYLPGPYRAFHIREPKPRMISAAPYRDRVVHHALMNVLEPVFERRMDFDSYACRKGKGTHAALDRYTHYARRFPWVWHGDVSKFFPSIDHAILKDLVKRMVKDVNVLRLAGIIIDASNPQEGITAWFPGDGLLAPLERRRGLPIGNLTSQWFANIYLARFDEYVRQGLRAPGYVRYCDDFCLFADDKTRLNEWISACGRFLGGRLRLELNPRRRQAAPVRRGLGFLGFHVYPDRRRVMPDALMRSVRRVKERLAVDGSRLDAKGRLAACMPWIAHISHADTWGFRGMMLTRLGKSGHP